MWKKPGALGLCVALLTGISACSSQPADNSTKTPATSANSTHYPLTVSTYDFGFKKVDVTFTEAPKKVLVDGQNNIELMLALGLGDRIALAPAMDDNIQPSLKDSYSKIKTTAKLPSKEEAVALNPDFILGWYGAFSNKMLGDVGFWHNRGTKTYMSLNSYAQGPDVPREIKWEYEDILTIGQIFDKAKEAQSLVDSMKAEVTKAQQHAQGKPSPKVAILESSKGKYRVYGSKDLAGSMVTSLGATLAVGASGDKTASLGAEDLVTADPDKIFIVHYHGGQSPSEAVSTIMDNPALASLKAVKNKQVYPVNLSQIYCSGTRTLDGLKTLTAGLYPDVR